jgi:hypothetical protein
MEFYQNGEKIQVDVYEDDTIEMTLYKLSVVLKCSIDDLYMFSSRYYETFTTAQQYSRLYDKE